MLNLKKLKKIVHNIFWEDSLPPGSIPGEDVHDGMIRHFHSRSKFIYKNLFSICAIIISIIALLISIVK